MIQYKLLEILDKNTLDKVISIFGSKNIYQFTNNIIGVNYDFKTQTYRDVLQKIVGLNLRQYTITSSRFIKIIDYAISNNLHLGSIDFLEFIDLDHINGINKNIVKINSIKDMREKLDFKKFIIDDLNWIMLDECIDIKSIFITYFIKNYPFTVDVKFFNNGVIYINDDKTPEDLNLLFKNIFYRE